MHMIIPHLWFDTEAMEAAEFYVSVFPDTRITGIYVLHDVPTPTGDCAVVLFDLAGQPFSAMNAGPAFKINPSASFILNFDPSQDKDARESLDALWDRLAEGGRALMPLDTYPFSDRYGWIEDRFGVSWQLILSNPAGEVRPFVTPAIMFVGEVCGDAEAATEFYMSVFPNTQRGQIVRYPAGMEPDAEGTVMFTDFKINGQWFAAMDSAHAHEFAFNQAVSFMIPCDTQPEIDYYWDKLSADPAAGQCGWLKDKYGLSWQVWPVRMGEMMRTGTRAQINRVTQAFLPMKKYDLARLEAAFSGA